jgi:hypothetical protein
MRQQLHKDFMFDHDEVIKMIRSNPLYRQALGKLDDEERQKVDANAERMISQLFGALAPVISKAQQEQADIDIAKVVKESTGKVEGTQVADVNE